MKRLKLKVPVNGVASARLQSKAGADEFYVAYESDIKSNLTFSGRGKESYDKIKTMVTYDDFKEICKIAHDNGIIVEMAANVPWISDGPNGTEVQKHYLDYVIRAVEAGADRIIVGDIGNIIMLRENGVTIPITASVFLENFNIYQLKFLEKIGVQKVVLPHCVTFPEIEYLTKNSQLDIEVFCQFGCSFLQFNCALYHGAAEAINFGLPCRAKYRIKETGEMFRILDVGEDCAICALPKLAEIGVSSIKITGRDLDYKFASMFTFIYATAIKLVYEGFSDNRILETLKSKTDFQFWENAFCREDRCKYLSTAYYI